ncbi:MAG: sigma-70 family RNA polymerase sigma factor [Myxococcales bacterium]|nr:sigma-70 family RNA polymerase sigma factor [Myxococcales bacterium]MCB9700996.1 sigma-70 family RNA polymerase sigma factor [Myxococcales bacterium]
MPPPTRALPFPREPGASAPTRASRAPTTPRVVDPADPPRPGILSAPVRSVLEAAYRSHGPVVLRRARSILGNDADAREVVQEIFTSLLARPEQYSGQGSLMAFLYQATTNRCLNRLRDARNRLRLLDERGPPESSSAPRVEERAVLRQYLARLPEDQAQAVVYFYLDEMSQSEIAALLGCSRRHVGNLLERARAGLAAQEDAHP